MAEHPGNETPDTSDVMQDAAPPPAGSPGDRRLRERLEQAIERGGAL